MNQILKSIYYKYLLDELKTTYKSITFFEYLRDWRYKSATWKNDIIQECLLVNEIDFNTELQYIIDSLGIELQARCQERSRARDIAYEFMNEKKQSQAIKERVGNSLAFIDECISEECRYIGNAISGGNALSEALGETLEDRVKIEILERGILL